MAKKFEDLTNPGDVHFTCPPGLRVAMDRLQDKRTQETGERPDLGALWREGARSLLAKEGVEVVLNGDSPRKPARAAGKRKKAAA